MLSNSGKYTLVTNTEAILLSDEQRVQAEERHRRRIAADRFKMLVALGAVVALAFALVMIGLSVSYLGIRRGYRRRGTVLISLSETLAALMEEAAYSVAFVSPTSTAALGDEGRSDRERNAQLTALQEATRDAFAVAVVERVDICPACESVLGMFNFPTLVATQNRVQSRLLTPVEVFAFYTDAVTRLTGVLAYFTGWSTPDGISSMVWTDGLVGVCRLLASTSAAWQDAHELGSLSAARSTWYMSRALQGFTYKGAIAAVMASHEPGGSVETSESAFASLVSPVASPLQAMLLNATGNYSALSVTGTLSPAEAMASLLTSYRALLSQVSAADPWENLDGKQWACVIALSALLAVVSLVTAVATLREATELIRAADSKLTSMKATYRLSASLMRMHNFADCVYNMNQAGITEALELSALCGSSCPSVEQELMKLATPTRHVLSFVNPCVLDRLLLRRSRGIQNGDAFVDTGLRLRYVSLVMVSLRCFATDITAETCQTLPKELLVFLNDISALAAQCGGTILSISGTVLTMAWNVRAKGSAVSATATESTAAAGQARGSVSGVAADAPRPSSARRRSSSAKTRASVQLLHADMNADVSSSTPESDACQLLLRFRLTKLQHKYPRVQFAVVSGVCKQGIVGSSTLKSYVVAGNLVMLGRLLLECARLHDVAMVADTATFLKLEMHQFRKRALELVSLFGSDGAQTDGPAGDGPPNSGSIYDHAQGSVAGNATVAYELTVTGVEANDYSQLWNAAVDDLVNSNVDEARSKLLSWRKLFGERETFKRLHRLMDGACGLQGGTHYWTNEEGFEYRFII